MRAILKPAICYSGMIKALSRILPGLFVVIFWQTSNATLLIEEGFNYSTNTALGADAPWTGSTTSTGLRVIGGGLSLTNLQGAATNGNQLRLGGGTSGQARLLFSSTPILNQATNSVYVSFLLNCSLLPSNSTPFVAALLTGSAGSPNQPDDPLDLYFANATNGFKLRLSHTDDDPQSATNILATNVTHLVVLKYKFGGPGRCSLFVDPPTGGTNEPPYNFITQNEGNDATDLQQLLFNVSSSSSQGIWYLDTLRVGTSWADVTPLTRSVAVSGPFDQAICSGNPAVFNVVNTGTPPFAYQWRTNGIAIPGATQGSYTNLSPTATDTAIGYDVVVTDAFGSVTSLVARITISQVAPSMISQPANQIVYPGDTSASFKIVASGDAPLTYQWCVNGAPILGETNISYTLTNPGPADALNTLQVIVANPCGAVTSAPPVSVLFPNTFDLCDSLPGFFSGMNLFTTQPSGKSLYCWSSPDPGQPIPNWTMEGPMFESPLNDGSGNSSYSINVNPAVSPVYYLVGPSLSPPYIQPVPLSWITTDADGFYSYFTADYSVDGNNMLQLPTPPLIAQPPSEQTTMTGKTVNFSVAATGTSPLFFQWYFNSAAPLVNASNSLLTLDGVTATNAGNYYVVVTNSYGSVTSSAAALAVLAPAVIATKAVSGGLQLGGYGLPGDIYLLQTATNLSSPVKWLTQATNVADALGWVQFIDTNAYLLRQCYYRFASPITTPAAPAIFQQPASAVVLTGGKAAFNLTVAGAYPLGLHWYFQTNSPQDYGSNTPLRIQPVLPANGGIYFAVITNAYGAVTSRIASLTVLPPPVLSIKMMPAGIQFYGHGVPGDGYWIQMATNLVPPVTWANVATNMADASGLIAYSETNSGTYLRRFYRLLAP